ncbi:MAG: CPBP family intramembrane metalloprotease [Candidatus Chromulinivorax sp.]|nr:CPBP family intramembrane metalloprotease [Candidatus Chromulinivorax sp.]
MVLGKSRNFWVSFVALSLSAAFLSHRYIGQVYSLINLSITADREQVLAQAQELAQELQWDLAGYQNVTSFENEDDLQCFVELEAGGKDAFVDMFQSQAYHPYHWHVRFFKPKEVVEMHAWFSPEGKRLGFAQKLSELTPGAALTKEQALEIIEQQIVAWCPHFENYKLIEYDSQTHDTGRIDHQFTYERMDLVIGKGFYRFNAVVRGDIVTKLEPAVKIPDNFTRRYQQMRSANNLLASVGSFFFRFLYLLFFGLLGLVFFYRRNYLLARSSCIAAAAVAGGMFLRGLNDYPLWWASYNTVQSSFTFIAMKLFGEIISFICLFGIIFFTLVVAEAAGRFVYKHHVQFFQIYSVSAVGSWQIAQQVVYGYLMVPFMFAYVIGFAYVTETYFGWWSPASSLSEPNVIASFFPWFGAVAISLYAGFCEEVVFRALPIAMTTVLTRDSKYKKFWFGLIFFVQALIFAACHANYPNQPFYARLIQLIIPSFGFGAIYLNFGLLPGIITHFTYDAILFALPVFVSNLFWSKVMVVFLIGLPLWIVVAVYAYSRKWHTLPAQYFNQAFHEVEFVEVEKLPRRIGEEVPVRNRRLLVVLGLCGLIAWVTMYKFSSDTHQLLVTRSVAINIARQAVHDKFGADLDAAWTPVVIIQDDCATVESRFIWQQYGKDMYDLAVGSYLTGTNWFVRFVQFSGDVEARGEEYQIIISSTHLDKHVTRQPLNLHAGHVMKVRHVLPEHFAGADILQEQAQQIVHDFIEKEYLLQPQDIKLISVNSDKFDERRDWTIVMQDTQVFDFGLGGQARIKVKVSGDKVSECSRFIFVPEDWDRTDQARVMNLNLAKSGLWFLMFILMALGCMFGITWLMKSRLGGHMMRHKALFVGTVSMFYALNSFYVYLGAFNTAEPFYDQLTRISLGLVTKMSYQILFCSIFLAVGAVGFVRGIQSKFIQSILLSSAAASIVLGISSLLNWLEPLLEPVSGNYTAIGHWLPSFAFCAGYIKTYYLILSLMIAMFVVLKTLRNMWPDRIWMQLVCTILFCLSLEALQVSSSIWWMLLHGVIIGCVVFGIYYLLLQYDMTLLPLTFGVFMIGQIIPELLYPSYVGAFADGWMAIVSILWISWFFYERAHQE